VQILQEVVELVQILQEVVELVQILQEQFLVELEQILLLVEL
jgi:hypothetical protein